MRSAKAFMGLSIICTLMLSFCSLPCLAQSLSADGKSPNDAEELFKARARIAELEAKIAELEQALKQKEPATEIAQPRVQQVETEAEVEDPYRFDPRDGKFTFLNLGVHKDYITIERNRLIDQIHTMIPPIYEPAFSPFHGYTLPPRALRVAINADRFTNHEDFGRDKFYAKFFNHIVVENQFVSFDLFYGLNHDHTLRINVPFKTTNVNGTGEAFRIDGMNMTMEGRAFGLGDVQVMLKKKWLDQGYKPLNFATVFGVQIPTGKRDHKFFDSQTIFMPDKAIAVSDAAGGPKVDLFTDDRRLPNGAQPGTGSWGINFGVMATRQLTWNRFRGAIHGGAMYRWMEVNPEGIRPGNEFIFSVSYVRPLLAWSERWSEHFSLDITLFGRNKQSERFPGLITHPERDPRIMNPDGTMAMFTTPRPPFDHGTIAFLAPSISIMPKPLLRLTISPLIRVYEPLRGPSPAFRLIFGITTTF